MLTSNLITCTMSSGGVGLLSTVEVLSESPEANGNLQQISITGMIVNITTVEYGHLLFIVLLVGFIFDRTAVTTLLSSMSGGIVGTFLSYVFQKKKFDIGYLVNSILGALVSITASCPLVRPWEAIIIGAVGGCVTIGADALLDKLKIDDPVSAVAVHGACGTWGMIAVGLFAADDRVENLTNGRNGLFHGGGFRMLGVQLLAIVCEMSWSAASTFIILYPIHKTIGIRMTLEDEILGADIVEHNVIKGDFTSQLTFTAHGEGRIHQQYQQQPTVSKLVPSIHGLAVDPKARDNKKWATDIVTLASLENMDRGRRRSSLSWLHHDTNGVDRHAPTHEYLAQAYPA